MSVTVAVEMISIVTWPPKVTRKWFYGDMGWGLRVKVSVVRATSFLDLCGGCNDIIFNREKGDKLDIS